MTKCLLEPELTRRNPGWFFLMTFLLLTASAWGQNLRIGNAVNDCPAFVEVPVTFVQPDGSPVSTLAFEFTYNATAFQEQYFAPNDVSNRPLVLRGGALLAGSGLSAQVISSKLSGSGTVLPAGIWRISIIQPGGATIPGGEILRLRFYPIAGSPTASYPVNFNPGSVTATNAAGVALPPLSVVGGTITLLPCPGSTTTVPPTSTTLPPTTTTSTTLPPTTTTLPLTTTTSTTLPPTSTTLPPTTTTLPPTTTTSTTLPPTTTTLPPTTTLPQTTTTTTTLPPATTTTSSTSTTSTSSSTTTTMPGLGPSTVLEFPQVAVGLGYRGFLIVENPNNASVQVAASFRNPFGQSLVLQINGVAASSHIFTLPAQGATKLRLEDPGNVIKTGWCQVYGTRPISGVLVYQLVSGGEVVSEASVFPSPRSKKFSLLVTQLGSATETGLAIANPEELPASMVLRRLTNDGFVVAETALSLGPGEQIARFVSQYFPSGLATLEGRMEILSNRSMVAVGLIYQNTTFTALPVMPLP